MSLLGQTTSPTALPRRKWLRFSAWHLPAYLVAGLVLMPLSVILLSWLQPATDIWRHLFDTQLFMLLKNTGILVFGVSLAVLILGVSLGWLVAMCDFPGRRWLDWGLMLPLAIPPYVLAFVMVGVFDFSGPVNTWLRSVFGSDASTGDIRSPFGVVLVMALVLYPYVYMLARGAFLAQGQELMAAARSLGATPWQAFWRVGLPMARPAIAAGVALAVMESLADFGAVSIFNFNTFTTAIYKAWSGFFNLAAATQLASLLLLLVLVGLWAEQAARGRRQYRQKRGSEQLRTRLRGGSALAAAGFGGFVFAVAFALPMAQLVIWAWQHAPLLDARYWGFLMNSLVLASGAALVAVALALLVAFGQRQASPPVASFWLKLASLGYALPGSVLAVGLLMALTVIDQNLLGPMASLFGGGPILVGTIIGLLLAYVIRFFSVSLGPVQAGVESIQPHYQEVAQTLGAGRFRILWRVYLPLLRPGLLTALLLVFVDTLKEMPATLILRPFGWDTLAVRIFELTAEGHWLRASVPALTLVLASVLPVVFLIRRSREN